MSVVTVAPDVYWVGAKDFAVRDFHGYKTPYGTTYNAYLILDEKVTLVDTVKAPFAREMIDNIREIIDPAKIDCVVSNHVEPDHSGAMQAILALCPNATVFTSPNGLKGLNAYYRDNGWHMQVVKSGESLSLGKVSLKFLHMPMVHWPDSMATYLPEHKLLFANDAFGQHIATEERFADEVGYDTVYARAKDYYANIVMPFGMPVGRVMKDAGALDIEIIAPSHGLMWRGDLSGILSRYADWSQYKTRDDLAVIAFDTMWQSTAQMAEHLAEDLRAQGKTVRVMSLRESHISEVVAEAIDAGTIYIGSSTLNRGMMPQVAALLHYMKGLGFHGRRGRAFGSYGWSGESVDLVDEALQEMGFVNEPPLKTQYRPD